MSTSVHEMQISGTRRQRTWCVAVAAFVIVWDIVLVPWAAAYVLGVRLPILDLGPEQYASWLVSPTIAMVVLALSLGSIVSLRLCSEFRGFRWVMAISIAWVAFSLYAQWQAELGAVLTAFFLVRRVAVVALVWWGRRAFTSG